MNAGHTGVRVRAARGVTTRGSEVGYLVRERNGVKEDGAWLVFEVESTLHLLLFLPSEKTHVDYPTIRHRESVTGETFKRALTVLPRHSRVAA